MMVCVDGNLMQAIEAKITISDKARSAFLALLWPGNIPSESDKSKIIRYMLERYIKIRDCWFVKYMKTSQDKPIVNIKAGAQPARAEVAN